MLLENSPSVLWQIASHCVPRIETCALRRTRHLAILSKFVYVLQVMAGVQRTVSHYCQWQWSGKDKIYTYLQGLKQVLACRIPFPPILDWVSGEVGETVIGVVLVIEENSLPSWRRPLRIVYVPTWIVPRWSCSALDIAIDSGLTRTRPVQEGEAWTNVHRARSSVVVPWLRKR